LRPPGVQRMLPPQVCQPCFTQDGESYGKKLALINPLGESQPAAANYWLQTGDARRFGGRIAC
ncbi:MAG: hypothetical protein ABI556_15520, partial [Gemmatimonadales bacterium]